MEYLQYSMIRKSKYYKVVFVLNLVISGIPSILNWYDLTDATESVLNLVISGIPSIRN